MKVRVQHWRFEDGVTPIHEDSKFGDTVMPRGWYGWAYTNDDVVFENWMANNCPTADYTHRFNSGNPMYTVYISNDAEASIFSLRWL
jgi:hypothetical protein